MRYLLPLLLAILPACAVLTPQQAEAPKEKVYIYTASNGVARLFEARCEKESVLQHIPPQYREQFMAGEGTYDGPRYDLCWFVRADGAIVLVWEDGGFGTIDPARLEVEKPV